MDPYQLFSTPPGDVVMSSTPLKPRAQKALTPTGKGCRGPKTSTPAKREANKSVSLSTPAAISKRSRAPNKGKKQKKENLWDKHLKKNPDLAQFVDEFNHSLEEATSKPLDIES
jgi:hypothetical protein